jgi:phospholipase/lecithinase/hemolysin
MKIKLLLLTLICLISSVAQATTPKSIIVFGESFSDSGNLYDLYDGWGLEPDTWGWFTDGRIGDGPNWADYLADRYKHVPPMEASSRGGTNYAIGGADSSFGLGFYGYGSTGMQVNQFLTDAGHLQGRGNVLIAYWIGGNDLGTGMPLEESMSNISIQLNQLIDAGALHFLIPNMIPLGFTPDVIEGYTIFDSPETANSAATSFNEALMEVLRETKCSRPSVHFYVVDTHQLMLEILADPLAYGFENTSDPVTWFGGDPDVSLWWDGVHFTSRFQALIAEAAFARISHHAGGLKCQLYAE